MEHLSIKINDLPDEILILILKKLYNADVLYSLTGVNKRFNTIAHNLTFASQLTLFCEFDNVISRLPDPMLDRICSQILPLIHHKIKSLKLESTSMERILLATNYPNLNELGLYGVNVEKALSLFTGSKPQAIVRHISTDTLSKTTLELSEAKAEIFDDISQIKKKGSLPITTLDSSVDPKLT
ncbi:unnamed protein product [Rotaria sp. Silwood2]|nr:unnamed protein product [Rotaria sp. Silwood2]